MALMKKGLSSKEAENVQKAKEQAERKREKKERAKAEKEQKEGERRRRALPKAKRLTSYLMAVIASIQISIEALAAGNEQEARAWFRKAKRSMTSARDSRILEEIAKDSPYINMAREIENYIVTTHQEMDDELPLEISALRDFNRKLGAIMKRIGDLLVVIYGADQAREVQQEAQRAIGARLRGVVRRRS
jgi:5'-3' exonuclease